MEADMSKKKIVVLLGSPRKKGNSTILAKRLVDGAQESGAEVETVYLNGLTIAPCIACDGCRKTSARGCVVDDDMQQIYPKLAVSDAVVWISPIYWFTVSAQLKAVMDRLYAFGADGYAALHGKQAAVGLTYGGSDTFDSGAVNALHTFRDMFGYLKMDWVGTIHGSAYDAGEVAADTALLDKATQLGRQLAGASD